MRPFGILTQSGEFVRGDVLDDYAVKADGASLQLPTQSTFEGQRGLLTPKYDPAHLAGLLEVNTAHLVACRQKAEDVLGRGWELVKARQDADDADRRTLAAWFDDIPPPETAISNLSHRSVFAAAQFDFESIGRGAFELIRADRRPDGQVDKIVHAPAHTLRVARDGVRFVQAKHGRRRWFKWAGANIDVDYETGETGDLGSMRAERRANEIVWWTNYHPADPVYGLPDIIPAVGAVHGDIGRRDYNIEFFSNFGIPAYAVFITGDFDPGDFVDADGNPVDESDPDGKYESEWHIEALMKKVRDNPHSSLVFTIPTRQGSEDGQVKIEFKPLATDVKEASFRLYRKDNREEVLSSHRMSAAIAGVFDAGAANREARGQYKQSVIYPRRSMLELVVNHFIVASFGDLGWKWKLKALDNREEEHDLDVMLKLRKEGAVSREELRQRFADRLGLDPNALPDDVPTSDEGAALMSLRDDLVSIALKSGSNGTGDLTQLAAGLQ